MSGFAFQNRVETIFKKLKHEKKASIPSKLCDFLPNGEKLTVFVITKDMLKKRKTIQLLATWRAKSNIYFPSQFCVTFKGTKKWAQEQLLEKKDRILFFLKIDSQNDPFGHIGFYRFDFSKKTCEIDNVIRGEESRQTKGGVSIGLKLLISFAFQDLHIKRLYLKVFSDNARALALYTRLGFLELDRTPLIEKRENNVISWVENNTIDKNAKRYFVKMYLDRYRNE